MGTVFATESPYACDKIRQIFSQNLKEEELVDEFAPPSVDPKKLKTCYIPDDSPLDFSGILIGTEALVFPPCSSDSIGSAWSELPPLHQNLKVLDLGHDGVIWGIRDDKSEKSVAKDKWSDQTACRTILKSLPNLQKVYYCGYYSQVDLEEVAKDFPNIVFEAIY